MTRRLAALAAATCALLVAGCGDTFIDSTKAESEIERAIETQAGVRVAEVRCPDDVKARAGHEFNCAARGENGGTAVVNVRQTDDEGNVEFRAPDLGALR